MIAATVARTEERGGVSRKRAKWRKWTNEEIDRLRAFYAEHTISEVCVALEMTPSQVKSALKRFDIRKSAKWISGRGEITGLQVRDRHLTRGVNGRFS